MATAKKNEPSVTATEALEAAHEALTELVRATYLSTVERWEITRARSGVPRPFLVTEALEKLTAALLREK